MKRLLLPLCIVGTLFATACGVEGRYYVSAPPPIRVETRLVSPGPGYVWVEGYWGAGRSSYAWVPGRWVRPPRGRSRWEAPRWERRGDRYEFRKGQWR